MARIFVSVDAKSRLCARTRVSHITFSDKLLRLQNELLTVAGARGGGGITGEGKVGLREGGAECVGEAAESG